MKRTFFTLVFLILAIGSNGQTLQWAKNIYHNHPGTNKPYMSDMDTDTAGNIFICGTMGNDTLDMDPSSGEYNIVPINNGRKYIAKYSSSGTILWAYNLNNHWAPDNDGEHIIVGPNQNVYITGRFSGTVDFDPNPNSIDTITPGGYDIYISKYSNQGTYLWTKNFRCMSAGGLYSNYLKDIKIDDLGNIYCIGSSVLNTDYNPGPGIDTINSSHFVTKLDSNGNFIWVTGSGAENNGLALYNNAEVIVSGRYQGTADFDYGPGSHILTTTGKDVYVLKLDSAGAFVWVKGFYSGQPNVSDNIGNRVDVDTYGNIYVTGKFTTSLDTSLLSTIVGSVYRNSFICKLNPQGSILWGKVIGDINFPEVCVGEHIEVHDTNVFVGGTFGNWFFSNQNIIDFDPGPGKYVKASEGDEDFYIVKLDTSGNFYWAKMFGGLGKDKCAGFSIKNNGDIVFGGFSDDSLDIDPSTSIHRLMNDSVGYGGSTFFGVLSDCCQPYQTIPIVACDSIIVNGVQYTQSGCYLQLFNDANGCDSNTIYDINIYNTVNAYSLIVCDSLNFNGNTYYSSGMVIDTFNSAITNCDSIVQITLTVHHSTFNSITDTSCNQYIYNGQLYNSSGTYYDTLVNAVGCDSVVELNLIINYSSNDTIVQSGCDSILYGGQLYTSSGIYYQTLTRANGCDSVLTLDFTVTSFYSYISTVNSPNLTANPSNSTYQWAKCNPFSLILGATSQSFVIPSNGYYAAIISRNGCSDTTSCKYAGGLGVNDLALKDILVYPNPTHDRISISFTHVLKNSSLKILNILGQVIYEKGKLSGKSFEVDLTNYASGLYTLELMEDDKVSRIKVLKR